MFAHTYDMQVDATSLTAWDWKQRCSTPFNELIVSWNGERPLKGKWTFLVSLFQNGWSPWLPYAEWGVDGQKTFKSDPAGSLAATYQDAAFSKMGLCSAFRIRVTADSGADLSGLDRIFACASNLLKLEIAQPKQLAPIVPLNVPGISQMKLNHPRKDSLCSPTSLANALNYLLGSSSIDPLSLASKIHDNGWDIYGNWILNTAQGYCDTNKRFACHVQRLNGWDDLHAYLSQGLPVIVSIRGPIPGSAEPYASGHLICVTGYDSALQRVHCVDPAFDAPTETLASYPLSDFLAAWARRQNIAYVFPKNSR